LQPLQVKNKEVLRLIFPKKEVIEYIDKSLPYETNNIIHVHIVTYGSQRSGKTSVARKLVEIAVQKYGIENVCAAIIKQDLDFLMHQGLNMDGEGKMVQVLVCDDITLEKFDPEVLQQYLQIRHLMKEKTGRSTGLIITILNIHEFMYGIKDKVLRSNIPLLLFRSSATNPHDRNMIKMFIGDDGLQVLESLDEEKLKNPQSDAWGYTYFHSVGGMKGLIFLPMAKEDYMKQLKREEIAPTQAPVVIKRIAPSPYINQQRVVTRKRGVTKTQGYVILLLWAAFCFGLAYYWFITHQPPPG
jgi:hypothetical protein